jgi:hypothetical protein
MTVDAVTDEPLSGPVPKVPDNREICRDFRHCRLEFLHSTFCNTHIGKGLLVVSAFHTWQQNRELNSPIKEMIARKQGIVNRFNLGWNCRHHVLRTIT